MRLFTAMLLMCTTSLYGWMDTVADQFTEHCHVAQGQHHEESSADHGHKHSSEHGQSDHDRDQPSESDTCGDCCATSHVPTTGFIVSTESRLIQRAPMLKEFATHHVSAPDAISARPDTPPPKA